MNLVTIAISAAVFVFSSWMTSRLSAPASRLRLYDYPNERSLHARPVPRTGGLAILASLAVGILLEVSRAFINGKLPGLEARPGFWVVSMALLIAAVSLWDDWVELPSGLRLGVHGLAAVAVVFGAGLSIKTVAVPLLGSWSLGLLGVPFAVLCLVWMTNLYNFMDGMDGFAGGMTIIGFGFLSYLGWAGGHAFISSLSLLAAGASAGFLLFNWPPAKIFMGDVGSALLGFLAGSLSLMGISQGAFDLWVPVLIFSPFIVDATATLLRRLLRGEKIWQAHREHYYQRVVLLGWSHRKTVLAEYCFMIACGISAVLYTGVGERARLALLLGWAFIYSALAYGVHLAEKRSKGPHAVYSHEIGK